jgi:hypothetical protein
MMTTGDYVPASFSCTLLLTMLRDGAQTLSEVRVPVLSVVCEPCGRRERYDVERLTRKYGWDAKLTDLLPALVLDCPNAHLLRQGARVAVNSRKSAPRRKAPSVLFNITLPDSDLQANDQRSSVTDSSTTSRAVPSANGFEITNTGRPAG